ncbi:MAG: DUF1566 domain-containing protein [Nitrospira sp.]
MNTMRYTWPGAVVGVVLVGGGLLMNYGTEVASVNTQAVLANQLTVMVNKVSHIIAPVGGASIKRSYPAEDVTNSSAPRFVAAFPGAVLDKHTGLVWEETPDATLRTWTDATRYCASKTVGGTIGWRLPSMVELKSVQDQPMASPSVSASLLSGLQPTSFWSTSIPAKDPIGGNNSFTLPAWCVRGGVNSEQY